MSERGVTETAPGFDLVKKAMVRQSGRRHFLIDSSKCSEIGELLVDRAAEGSLATAVVATRV